MTVPSGPDAIEFAGIDPLTTVIGRSRAERPMWAPPKTMHLEVIQTPGSIRIGRVTSAMSRR